MDQDAANTMKDDLVANITETLNDTETWVQSVLSSVGWTEDYILELEERLPCPIDQNHIIPKSKMDRHLLNCPLLKAGYTKNELEEERAKSSKFFYEKANNVVSIDLDDATISNIVSRHASSTWAQATQHAQGSTRKPLPATMERVMSDLSAEERLRLYEFCVQTARATKKIKTIPDEDLQLLESKDKDEGRPMSFAERRAAERDLKRRRQSYRNKGVHTANKSYSEVIREVIVQQSELLADKWKSEHKRHERTTDRKAEREMKHKLSDDRDKRKSEKDSAAEDDREEDYDRNGDKHQKTKRARSSTPEVSDSGSHSSKHKKHKHKKHKKHKSKSKNKDGKE